MRGRLGGRRRWPAGVAVVAAVYFVAWGVTGWLDGGKLSATQTERAWAERDYHDVSCKAIPNSAKPFSTDTDDDYDYRCSYRVATRREIVLVGVNASSITTISP
jgi:hypothetical protein